ncbi:MAG: two-component system response regulator CreB [Gammaproteobacteria bacterium]|nr:two-component system response regulator CreB [Gammaproteobacteria bacterium]MDH3465963.1 two-component system response regulator CreB [Gammaproteobacteria bacterium]
MANQKILLIEDEPSIADTVIYALRTENFRPLWRATGRDGIAAVRCEHPALVILDIGLPDQSGIDVYREIQALGPFPVIFLTARAAEVDRIVGLEIGADDYVTKPFSPRELTARVKAVLRRLGVQSTPIAGDSPFLVDSQRLLITYDGKALTLSRYEYRLLKVLIERPGRVFSRAQLLDLAWDAPEHRLDRTVDTHIKTLRAKLTAIRPGASVIKTHRGFGYSLQVTK